VFGRVVRSVPKGKMDELKAAIEKTVKEINSLSKDQLAKEYRQYEKEFERQEELKAESTSKPKMVLEGAAKGSFAIRFAPEPSGYLHIGHASAAFLAQEFARIYNGKNFLYFDDTNPEKEKQEFVDSAKLDLEWLGIKFEKEYYASDNIEKIYEYAKQLIKSDKAYACECDPDLIKKNRFEGKGCKHRDAKVNENLDKFEMMLKGKYDEGKIIVRFKGDIKSANTALRDPTLLRIKKAAHYRQGNKYVLWPTYDLNTPINDSLNGVTDAIRTKEYEFRDELYNMILDILKLRKPRLHLHSRIRIKGQPSSKRITTKLVEEGKLNGFDDPRLFTVAALRRRGIQPEAIREFVLNFGMSKADNAIDPSFLFNYNKKIIVPQSKRLFYVPGPIDLEIKNLKLTSIDLKLHPSKDMGTRKYEVSNNFYVSGKDAATFKNGDIVRLKEFMSLKVRKEDDSWIGEETKAETDKVLQWVCDGMKMKCSVLIPGELVDGEDNFKIGSMDVNYGYVESYANSLKEREIVQFERFGFCILDNKKEMKFIFISK